MEAVTILIDEQEHVMGYKMKNIMVFRQSNENLTTLYHRSEKFFMDKLGVSLSEAFKNDKVVYETLYRKKKENKEMRKRLSKNK